jgi:hypothetical protein
MATLIRLKQIESGSALQTSAEIGTDFSQSVVNIITSEVQAVLPTGVVSSSAQITLANTIGNLTGSRVVGGTQASSIDYSNILNKPTLVSGSTQVIGILDSLNNFTSSLDNTFATDVELSVTTSNLNIDMGEF